MIKCVVSKRKHSVRTMTVVRSKDVSVNPSTTMSMKATRHEYIYM
jgi:hypothetical protein